MNSSKSLTEELESLINPKPDEDIENENDDRAILTTKIQDVDLNDSEEPDNFYSKIRKNQVLKLSSFNSRYEGKKINRQEFAEGFEPKSEDDNEIEDEEYDEDDDEEGEDEEIEDEEDDDSESISNNQNDQNLNDLIKNNEKDLNILNDYDDQLKIKANVVKNQLAIYESLLGIRIKLQKMLTISNRLPSKTNYSIIRNNQNEEILNQSIKGLQKLQNTFLEIDKFIDQQNNENEDISEETTTNNNKNRKRKIPRCNESILSKRFCLLKESYPKIIDEWHDKTKFINSNINLKKFQSFDVKPSKTIEQILMDKDRLLDRTKIKRSVYDIIGEDNSKEINNDGDYKNEEIYDDDDFYHILLRQIIENKCNTNNNEDLLSSSKKFIEIQRLRNKSKKIVDTKASKGRKIRYDVHEKLVNFMAPIDTTTLNDEAKNDLFKSLFGNFHLNVEED